MTREAQVLRPNDDRPDRLDEPGLAELLDPVALEARLQEARARRSAALSRRAAGAAPAPPPEPPAPAASRRRPLARAGAASFPGSCSRSASPSAAPVPRCWCSPTCAATSRS